MSYRRSYSETIVVSGSKTVSVSYPASQHGGSTSATVHYTEHVPVNVDILVETTPFDSSVAQCANRVDLLTGAVVATEAAQLVSINAGAKRVARTVIDGFFGHIRSEIGQQITELEQTIGSYQLHLRELADAVLALRQRMEDDFQRLGDRYGKLFETLNKELENRVHELDRPAFQLWREGEATNARRTGNDMVNMVAVHGGESAGLRTRIGTGVTKWMTREAINASRDFLVGQRKLDKILRERSAVGLQEGRTCMPVCLVQALDVQGKPDHTMHLATPFQGNGAEAVRRGAAWATADHGLSWRPLDPVAKAELTRAFNARFHSTYGSADGRVDRLKRTVVGLVDMDAVECLSTATLPSRP